MLTIEKRKRIPAFDCYAPLISTFNLAFGCAVLLRISAVARKVAVLLLILPNTFFYRLVASGIVLLSGLVVKSIVRTMYNRQIH